MVEARCVGWPTDAHHGRGDGDIAAHGGFNGAASIQ
jgi:hypothetical protein